MEAPTFFCGSFLFHTLKEGDNCAQGKNEVVKKASTLTASGDPHLSGRSLFRGLAFLSTVPGKVTLSRQRRLSLHRLKHTDMEKYNQIQYVIGKDDLKEIINEIIDERFAEKKEDELVSTKKVMEMLGVTDATLWRWDKMGILKKVRIGNRVYYRRSDIIKIADGQ